MTRRMASKLRVARSEDSEESETEAAKDPPAPKPADAVGLDARVDGRRVRIEGQEEITLVCGKASITLRSNGRVSIRGVLIETDARGVNRIRGGQVRIN